MGESKSVSPSELVRDNLRTLRRIARLSQSEVLDRLEELGAPMDQAALSRKESGARAITLEDLYRFAAVLDVTPAELLMPRQARGEVALTPETVETNARFRSWLRGRRRLARFPGPEEDRYLLGDEDLVQQATSLAHQWLEATQALRKCAEWLEFAKEQLADLEKQPSFELYDSAIEPRVEAAQGAVRVQERAFREATERERQLCEGIDKLRSQNADAGWIEPDELDELIEQAGGPGTTNVGRH